MRKYGTPSLGAPVQLAGARSRRARRRTAPTGSMVYSRTAFSLGPCEITLQPRNAAWRLAQPASTGDRPGVDGGHHITWQALPANTNPDCRPHSRGASRATVSHAVTSLIAPAPDLDAGQREIPTLSQHCRCLPTSRADPEKPTDGNPAGFSAWVNFSHFSFAVWQLLVYNETTERG